MLGTLVLLTLCSTAATARRAQDGEEDAALVEREKGSEEGATTHCACFLEWAETEREKRTSKLTELHGFDYYVSRQECANGCPGECHKDLKYKFDPGDSQAWAEDPSVPVTASRCSNEALCMCLDGAAATRRLKRFDEKEGRHIEIAEIKKVYDSPKQCLESCECKEKSGHQGLCVDQWRWDWFAYRHQDCISTPTVGLVNCKFLQRFKLKEDRSSGSSTYKVELEGLLKTPHSRKMSSFEDLNIQVMNVGAEKSRSFDIVVGTAGMKTTWTAKQGGVMNRGTWTLEDMSGKVAFSIRQKKKDAWKVYRGKEVNFYVYRETFKKKKGFTFGFYNNKEGMFDKARLTHWKDEDQDEYTAVVKEGSDAGLILITGVLIDRAYNAAER